MVLYGALDVGVGRRGEEYGAVPGAIICAVQPWDLLLFSALFLGVGHKKVWGSPGRGVGSSGQT